jgi:ribulose-phosphate 3-epimerase
MLKLAPSLLAADFSQLKTELAKIENEADMLHLDVMDGQFVPNISFGIPVVQALRPHSRLLFDAHLMLARPDRYIEAFAKAGADLITVHAECEADVAETLQRIRALGLKAGLALNPPTAFETLLPFEGRFDLLLLMTVHPGFGGQKYIEPVNEKISAARNWLGDDFDIQVDGGVYLENLSMPVAHGANVIVAGTAVFGADNPAAAARAFWRFSL